MRRRMGHASRRTIGHQAVIPAVHEQLHSAEDVAAPQHLIAGNEPRRRIIKYIPKCGSEALSRFGKRCFYALRLQSGLCDVIEFEHDMACAVERDVICRYLRRDLHDRTRRFHERQRAPPRILRPAAARIK